MNTDPKVKRGLADRIVRKLANDGGMSISELKNTYGVSERCVMEAVETLRNAGYVRIASREGYTTYHTTKEGDQYAVALEGREVAQ
jgi:Mn-dependent DtxR family transcriptional regulator